MFADAFSIESNQGKSDVITVQKGLLGHSFNTLKCSVDLTLRGYYVQSQSLLRIVYENWVAFHYLSIWPEEADRWLSHDHNLNRKVPKHDTMIKKLMKHNKDFKSVNAREWYNAFGSFSHAGSANLLPQMSSDYILNETTVHYGSTFKGDRFVASAYAICVWINEMHLAVSSWIPKAYQWHEQRNKIEKKMMEFVDQMNKKSTGSINNVSPL